MRPPADPPAPPPRAVSAASFSAECEQAFKDMSTQESPNDFFVCGFKEGTSQMGLAAAGRGGMKAMADVLDAQFKSGIAVACFRVTAVDDRGVTVSYRTKLIHVIYTGPTVPRMQKAKVASFNASFKAPFNAQYFLQIDDVADLNEKDMESMLRKAGGAHAPTGYDFANTPPVAS